MLVSSLVVDINQTWD